MRSAAVALSGRRAVMRRRAPVRKQVNTKTESPLTRWSSSPVILGIGVGLLAGPLGLRLIEPQLPEDGSLIESVSEAVLLISLFCAGLRLRAPFEWAPWRAPLQLASVTTLSAALLAGVAAYLIFRMSLLQALLLAVILAPTDSALASDAYAPGEGEQELVPFALAAEGAMTSAVVVPVAVLVLTRMGVTAAGSAVLGSLTATALWSLAGGATAGWLIGTAASRWLALIDRDRQGDLLEEMIVFATGALAYVCALALRTDALLAALAAGLALSHAGRFRATRKQPLGARVLRIAGRAERGATVVVMVLLGTLLGAADFTPRTALYAAALLILVRPVAVRLGLGRPLVTAAQRRPMELFAARGPAALYCLALVAGNELPAAFSRQLESAALVVIVVSVVAGAVSALTARRTSPGAAV
ncbi:MAG TPA: cation:proton antiporter [Steroidobacteraceae bacterium]|nr:cation:proton antiporter [Steroidobacteraceae bacterium]